MNTVRLPSFYCATAITATALLLVAVPAAADIPSDAFPNFENYIKISGKAASVSGNPSSFAERFKSPEDGSVGIEALHYSKEAGKDVTVELDGRALVGSEDYLGKLLLTKNDVGSFEFGYKRFRTFYDGIGGFFPVNNSWQALQERELHTDRAKFWATAKFARPDQPSFELKYVNDLRNGRKDTTIWGDSDFTGIPIWTVSSLNPYSAARKVVPSYIDLGERQETLTAAMKHTIGNTVIELEVVNNRTNSLDTRWVNRFPDELKPFPAIPTNPASIIPPALANNPNVGFDTQGIKADVMSYTGKFETKISDLLTLFGGLSFQHAAADIYGNRQISLVMRTTSTAGVTTTAVGGFTPGGRPPYSFTTVAGSTSEDILTGNLGITYKPRSDTLLTLALKGEHLDMDGSNLVNYINNQIVQSTGVVTSITIPAPNTSKRSEKSWIPELNIRYTGFKDLALYGTFDYRYSPGDEVGSSTGVTTGNNTVLPSVVASSDNVKLNHGHYKVGANWTVSPLLTVRAEVFYKDHKNNFSGYGASAGSQYIMGYEFYGTKLTAIVRPSPTLTFSTRVVSQHGKMNTTSDAVAGVATADPYDSMDSSNVMFGETMDWTPSTQLYLQANLNVVHARISTSYPRAGGAGNDVLHDANNDYANGSFITGFVVDKLTDAEFQFTFYRADNYDPTNIVTVPYGAGVREYTATLGLKHKFSDRVIGNAKIGYFESTSDTTGGNTNFHGPVGYLSLTFAL